MPEGTVTLYPADNTRLRTEAAVGCGGAQVADGSAAVSDHQANGRAVSRQALTRMLAVTVDEGTTQRSGR